MELGSSNGHKHPSIKKPARRGLFYALDIWRIHRIAWQLYRWGIAGRINRLRLGILFLARLFGIQLHGSALLRQL